MKCLARLIVAGLALGLIASFPLVAQAAKEEIAVPAAAQPPAGVGALGRIEPKSRVISLSHDAGPEGARIETLDIVEGQRIEAGARVAVFSEYKLKQAQLLALQAMLPVTEARITAAEAAARLADAERGRAQKLLKEKAIARAEVDRLETTFAQAEAEAKALQAELAMTRADIVAAEEDLRRSQLFSPIAGTVLKIHHWPGERVGDQGIADIADLSAMDVVAEIYERDMPRVRPGQHARIRVPGTDMAFDGLVRELGYQVMKNDMNDTDPLADRDNRVVEIRITLPPEAATSLQHLIFMQVDVHISSE